MVGITVSSSDRVSVDSVFSDDELVDEYDDVFDDDGRGDDR